MTQITYKREMSVLFKKHEKGLCETLILKCINIGIEHNLMGIYFWDLNYKYIISI